MLAFRLVPDTVLTTCIVSTLPEPLMYTVIVFVIYAVKEALQNWLGGRVELWLSFEAAKSTPVPLFF